MVPDALQAATKEQQDERKVPFHLAVIGALALGAIFCGVALTSSVSDKGHSAISIPLNDLSTVQAKAFPIRKSAGSHENSGTQRAQANPTPIEPLTRSMTALGKFFGHKGLTEKENMMKKNMVEKNMMKNTRRMFIARQKQLAPNLMGEAAESDLITSLPGLRDEINFLQFSGYLDITETKKIFYWFVESQNDPVNDPVVYWTNGGPGCSGMIGFLGEHGPFRPQRPQAGGQTLALNPYSWNLVANMVYIEQPCGVGFSYSTAEDPASDYAASDESAAEDNLKVVFKFQEKFPHLAGNKFYLTAESYGGHYLPMWASKIVEFNSGVAAPEEALNFAGFLVGNPFTDLVENSLGTYGTFWGHQLVGEPTFMQWKENCYPEELDEGLCTDLEITMWEATSMLDPYALDYPVCTLDSGATTSSVGRSQRQRLLEIIRGGRLAPLVQARQAKSLAKARLASSDEDTDERYIFDACEDVWLTTYLNLASVKKAIHANEGIDWGECADIDFQFDFQWSDEAHPMEPYYHQLVDAVLAGTLDLRIWVFSGDDDSVCGTMGTQVWMRKLEYEVTQEWTPWMLEEQGAGYELIFEGGLKLVTVHSAGHEVPAYQPQRALAVFQAYLNGENLAA
uniref:Carboxypeptidase n=1 Tax=Fibrocapsa japonica TaxID=94617 RepID=A0A7S2Y0Z6_9STRA